MRHHTAYGISFLWILRFRISYFWGAASRGILLVILLLPLAGCGSSEYDARYEVALKKAKNAQPFVPLWRDATRLADDQVSVRIPFLFDKSSKSRAFDAESPEPRDKSFPLDPYRVQPHFLELAGHAVTYERMLSILDPRDGRRRTWPMYLTVWVDDASEQASRLESVMGATEDGSGVTDKDLAEFYRARIHKRLLAEFGEREKAMGSSRRLAATKIYKGVGLGWEAVDVPTPAGPDQTVKWHCLRVTGKQKFHQYGGGDDPNLPIAKDRMGDLIVFHRLDRAANPAAEGDEAAEPLRRHVVVAFRSTTGASVQEDLPKLAEAVVGTVELHPRRVESEEDAAADDASAE